ncbi:hypothetical protein CVU37_11345 [candidate division BRC1 bacterium HGW-BRC1-1]|nr:MAG: hypothetical protein CVU37_11345 [candidate division BRC1 bacterium HGW-BRC1-1]
MNPERDVGVTETTPDVEATGHAHEKSGRVSLSLLVLLALTAVAVFLRLWRLDLIPFTYDSAAALERTRETLNLGFPPPTGIINSMGFRNPPGLIWLLLPAGLASPWPEVTAAWQALLVLTGVTPLYWFARRRLAGPAWLVPVVLYLFLPVMVMGGRNIWAQNFLPMLGAWALWGAGWALDGSADAVRRARYGAFCLGMIALAVLVHPASALWLIMMSAWFVWLARRRDLSGGALLRGAMLSFIPFGSALLPSASDWWARRGTPLEAQPDFVRNFVEKIPPPDPVWQRMQESLASVFEPFASGGPLGGLGFLLTEEQRTWSHVLDFLFLAMGGVGVALVAWGVAQWVAKALRRESASHFRSQELLLLLWLALPAVVGGALVSHPNSTYFALGMPALFLLAGLPVSRLVEAGRDGLALRVAIFAAIIGGAGYATQHVNCMRIVDRTEVVPGPYYIALKVQRELACRLAEAGVGHGRLDHLSGSWYERSLSYLLSACVDEVRAKNPDATSAPPRMAVVEDVALLTSKPARADWLRANADFFVGTLGVKLFDDDRAEAQFILEYQLR